jgi:hypothetical protein
MMQLGRLGANWVGARNQFNEALSRSRDDLQLRVNSPRTGYHKGIIWLPPMTLHRHNAADLDGV